VEAASRVSTGLIPMPSDARARLGKGTSSGKEGGGVACRTAVPCRSPRVYGLRREEGNDT
jgi:hypothetical protein